MNGYLFFCITSLAPCAFAYSVNLTSRELYLEAGVWLGVGTLLFFVCWAIIRLARNRLQRMPLHTVKIKQADKEILAFLIAYLLPLASTSTLSLKGDLPTSVFIYLVIGVCIYHSNAFTFNPTLACFGYHFVEVENEENMTYLILTKRSLHACKISFEAVPLGDYLYLDIGTET